ncbi:MAG: hypothetical protein AAFR75_00645, partial [Pseudomonadota bacterium]
MIRASGARYGLADRAEQFCLCALHPVSFSPGRSSKQEAWRMSSLDHAPPEMTLFSAQTAQAKGLPLL